MAENKRAHLELVQGVINRLAGNSFAIKGWAVTLAAALLALGSLKADQNSFYLAYMPVAVFWGLDGYFLWQERLFRRLYVCISNKSEEHIDFSMDTSPFSNQESWPCSTVSVTLFPFYVTILIAIFIVGVIG